MVNGSRSAILALAACVVLIFALADGRSQHGIPAVADGLAPNVGRQTPESNRPAS
jgi:hypothetical protein